MFYTHKMEAENMDYETGENSFFQGFSPENSYIEMQKRIITQLNLCHHCYFNHEKEVVLNKETKLCPRCEDEKAEYDEEGEDDEVDQDDIECKILDGACPACGSISLTPYDEDGHCDHYCHYLSIVKADSCWGCREEQPNQLAHMDPGGCLYKDACDNGLVEKE